MQFFLLVAAVALGQNVNGVFLPDESLRNESINARTGYDLYRYFDRDLYGAPSRLSKPFQQVYVTERPSLEVDDSSEVVLVWTHTPGIPLMYEAREYQSILIAVHGWLYEYDDVIRPIGTGTGGRETFVGDDVCDVVPCSASEVCYPVYYCLFHTLLNGTSSNDLYLDNKLPVNRDCLYQNFGIDQRDGDQSTWRCAFYLSSVARSGSNQQLVPCQSEIWDLSPTNWREQDVDRNIQISQQGGLDSEGVYWRGRSNDASRFDETFALLLWNKPGVRCTLASPCQPDFDCTSIGSFTAVALGRYDEPMRLPWVLLASVAFRNIDQQLRNQYRELNNAILSLALETFTIDAFFPTKDQLFDLQNGLAGLGGILSILGGFVPVFGSSISAAGTIAAGVGTFLANSAAASGDPLQPQKTFAEDVSTFYNATLTAMDEAVTMLFEGKSIPPAGPNSFNITDMMKDGAWVDIDSLTSVSQLNQKIRIETLARSIDSLWKTYPTNKMWVLFVDLQDYKNSTQCAQGT